MNNSGCVNGNGNNTFGNNIVGVPACTEPHKNTKRLICGAIIVAIIILMIVYIYEITRVYNDETEESKNARFRRRVIDSLITLVIFSMASVAYVTCSMVKKMMEPDWNQLAQHTHYLSYLNGAMAHRTSNADLNALHTEYCNKFGNKLLPHGRPPF